MRKKLREIMDKEEGFTLVELLAVIAILAIIMAIAVPSIGNVISKSKTKAEAADKALIVDAARLAIISEDLDLETDSYISVNTLKDSGYLDLEVTAEDRPELEVHNGVVEITKAGKKYEYKEGSNFTEITKKALTGVD